MHSLHGGETASKYGVVKSKLSSQSDSETSIIDQVLTADISMLAGNFLCLLSLYYSDL